MIVFFNLNRQFVWWNMLMIIVDDNYFIIWGRTNSYYFLFHLRHKTHGVNMSIVIFVSSPTIYSWILCNWAPCWWHICIHIMSKTGNPPPVNLSASVYLKGRKRFVAGFDRSGMLAGIWVVKQAVKYPDTRPAKNNWLTAKQTVMPS